MSLSEKPAVKEKIGPKLAGKINSHLKRIVRSCPPCLILPGLTVLKKTATTVLSSLLQKQLRGVGHNNLRGTEARPQSCCRAIFLTDIITHLDLYKRFFVIIDEILTYC